MDYSYSISDLSYHMSNYSIQQRPKYPTVPDRWSPLPSECSSPSTDESVYSYQDDSPVLTPASSVTLSTASSRNNTYQYSNVRAQRQRALRQQCSSTHLAEIAELVSRMVNSGDQCSVCQRPPTPPPTSSASAAESTSHTPIRFARQNSDSSDGSVSPFSRVTFNEDENMPDSDECNVIDNDSSSVAGDDYESSSAPVFGDWHFGWGAGRNRAIESPAERKGCVTKDTRSRKQTRRR